jgi:hypothetical protein
VALAGAQKFERTIKHLLVACLCDRAGIPPTELQILALAERDRPYVDHNRFERLFA